MKKILFSFVALSILFIISSCGGVSKEDMVGEWTIDLTSAKADFGDNVSAQDRFALLAAQTAFLAGAKSKELDELVFKFSKGGKLTVGNEEFSIEGKWKLKDENLTISTVFMDIPLEITSQVEKDGEDINATVTGSEIISRIRNSNDDFKELMGLKSNYDNYKGVTFSVKFKKK